MLAGKLECISLVQRRGGWNRLEVGSDGARVSGLAIIGSAVPLPGLDLLTLINSDMH